MRKFYKRLIIPHMALGSRIRYYREKAGLTLEQLSDRSGVEVGTISALELRDSSRSKYATAIAAGLGMKLEMLENTESDYDVRALLTTPAPSSSQLISSEVGDRIELKGMRQIPVVGEVKGGDDGFLEEFQYPVGHGEGHVEYPSTDPNAYALRVRGDSMHPRYRAGEFVIVEPNIEAQEGDDVVVACANGKKMLKQLNWRRQGEIQLLSINNGYGPLTLMDAEIQSIQLVAGRARRNALKFL